jgi:uncharacterized protein (DUF952 family)
LEGILTVLYKICGTAEWKAALGAGEFKGSAIDLKDGYIHLSTSHQVSETARLHFAGVTGLMLVALREDSVRGNLKWEASRGGQLFPHIYGSIDPAQILWAKDLPWVDGAHVFPQDIAS